MAVSQQDKDLWNAARVSLSEFGKIYDPNNRNPTGTLTEYNRYKSIRSLSDLDSGSSIGGGGNSGGSGSSAGSKAADFVTKGLKSQDIADLGYYNSVSSLKMNEDFVFQLSDVSSSITQIVKESKGIGDFAGKLITTGLDKVTEQVFNILTQERDLRNKINSELGLTGELSRQLRTDIMDTTPAAMSMAFGFQEVSEYAVQMVEQTGKMTTFGKDVLQESQKTARAFYGNLEGLGKALDSFDKIGTGAKDAIKQIDAAGKSSLVLGLNARKVITEIGTNIGKLNEYGFRNGIDGLTRMVQKSKEFNLSMSEVFGLAEDLFDPDKAIALSAELQAIGGAIGDFNDPLKLMYMATNDAEGLQDAIIGVAGSLTTYNSEAGKFEISGANLRKARALAKELGIDYNELANTAIKASERSSAATALLSSGLQIDEKEKEFLTNISKMEGGQMIIDIPQSLADKLGIKETKVALDALGPDLAKGLLENQKAFEEMSVEDIARDQYTVTQNIEKDVSALLTLAKAEMAGGMREPLSKVDAYLKETSFAQSVKEKASLSSLQKPEPNLFSSVIKESQDILYAGYAKSLGISEDKLRNQNSNQNSNQTAAVVNYKHEHNFKTDGPVLDAVVREMYKSPSVVNEMRETVTPSQLDYTSFTLPPQFN